MANKKGNGSPHKHTSNVADFPEVKDKIVQSIELFSDSEYCGIQIRFTDQTAIDFTLETAVYVFPTLSDRTGGDETILKEYEPMRSHIQRTEE